MMISLNTKPKTRRKISPLKFQSTLISKKTIVAGSLSLYRACKLNVMIIVPNF